MSLKDHSTEAHFSTHNETLISELKTSNKHAKRRNKLSKKQLKQDALNYEQAERLYLLEKSKLQPSFKLSVTEFLLTEADFINDPEQASEAKFLSEHDVTPDERVLRFHLAMRNKGSYLRPHLVLERDNADSDNDLAMPMSDLLYFLPYKQLSAQHDLGSFFAYFVYRDQTTLPVVQKYLISKHQSSNLLRWEAVHTDTLYAMSHHKLSQLISSAGCASMFLNRDE